MPEIAIRLSPEELDNPEVSIRYALPDALVAAAPGLLATDGYDYDDETRMIVFLATERLDDALAAVLAALPALEVMGNRFTRGVVVAVCDETHGADRTKYRIVWPVAGGTLADR